MDTKQVFERFKQANPTPRTELHYTNDFTLLIAIILSARATDVSVNKATKELFKLISSPKEMFNLGQTELQKHISSIGLYNAKARNIINSSRILIDKYNNIVPKSFEDLISLPGVGRKSANVFLNCSIGKPTIAVDTHVFRVSNRIGLVTEKSLLKTEQSLMRVIPEEYLLYAHHWLVLHGRYVCKAQRPLCNDCIVNDLCKNRLFM
jgi:endonuclease III